MPAEKLVGPLPRSWQYTTLGEACSNGEGGVQTGPFGSQLHAADYVRVGIPSIMPQNIGDNRVLRDGIARVRCRTRNGSLGTVCAQATSSTAAVATLSGGHSSATPRTDGCVGQDACGSGSTRSMSIRTMPRTTWATLEYVSG